MEEAGSVNVDGETLRLQALRPQRRLFLCTIFFLFTWLCPILVVAFWIFGCDT